VPTVLSDMKKAGINNFAKIVASKENAEVFKKYAAAPNTLVICASNGDRLVTLTGEQCTQVNVSNELKTFKAKLAAQQAQQKKTP
jgi:hypothetical protein